MASSRLISSLFTYSKKWLVIAFFIAFDLKFNCCMISRYETLSSMKASDELTDEQVRQMLFDLEQAYNSFNRSLQHT